MVNKYHEHEHERHDHPLHPTCIRAHRHREPPTRAWLNLLFLCWARYHRVDSSWSIDCLRVGRSSLRSTGVGAWPKD